MKHENYGATWKNNNKVVKSSRRNVIRKKLKKNGGPSSRVQELQKTCDMVQESILGEKDIPKSGNQ